MRLIESDADLAEGSAYLQSVSPIWAAALPVLHLPLRLRPDGFNAVLEAIIGQKISLASANAVLEKLKMAGLTTAPAIRCAAPDALLACGVSRAKVKYLSALAQAEPDWQALRSQSDDAVRQRLISLQGVGPWTAEIYLAFALGRPDAFPSGDLAMQEAARVLFGLPARPTSVQLTKLAEPWRPWRAVAARGLWAYYAVIRGHAAV